MTLAAVRVVLGSIARLARRELPRCDATSITYLGDGGSTTLSIGPELVRAVDEAQYAGGDGPYPAGEQFDTTIKWPGFHAEALRLGLRSAVAVPLFTATGEPVASLDLWSRSATAMESLHAAFVELFGSYATLTYWVAPAGLDAGERLLLEGLRNALKLRTVINRAAGYLAAQHQVPLDEAFEQLRSDARAAGSDIACTARRLLPS